MSKPAVAQSGLGGEWGPRVPRSVTGWPAALSFMEKVVDPDYPHGKGTAVSAKLALAALIALGGSAMAAEPYPDHPVTLIVPYAAGGSSDVLARLLGERWSKSLGQPIVIDNRAGAGSRLGIQVAARSAPDGYTLLLADMPHTIIPAIQKGVHYDPVRDFTPIGLIGTASMFFFVNPAVKAETARDFVALAKADPEKITIASGGIGSATHLTAELLQARAGIKLVQVPFRGAGPAMNDLVAGHVQSASPRSRRRARCSIAFARSRSQARRGWRRGRVFRRSGTTASISSSSIGGACSLRPACRRRSPRASRETSNPFSTRTSLRRALSRWASRRPRPHLRSSKP